MVAFCAVMVVMILAFVVAIWSSLKDQRTEIKGAPISWEQARCAGIWMGVAPSGTFYISLVQANQHIKGSYRVGAQQQEFTGKYVAPRLFFDLSNFDGTNSVITAYLSKDGSSFSGQNWNETRGQIHNWTTHRIWPESKQEDDHPDTANLDKLKLKVESIVATKSLPAQEMEQSPEPPSN